MKTLVYFPVKRTAKNTTISPNFLVWKFCGKAQFPQNFHTWKLGEISVFFAVEDETNFLEPQIKLKGSNFK